MGSEYIPGTHQVHGWAWKPSPPDHRDADYAFKAPRRFSGPTLADLSLPKLGSPFEPALDQSSLGSCGPNSAAECLIWEGMVAQDISPMPMPSRLGIYYSARTVMGTVNADSGVDNRSMLKALASYGWWNEDGPDGWPYVITRFTAPPPAGYFQNALTRKIDQYLSVAQNLSDMQACLTLGNSGKGSPFIFGFTVYQSWESPQVSQTGIVPLPQRGERALGGHDVTFVGYNAGPNAPGVLPGHVWPSQTFKFKNHYGPLWGDGGYGYMPFSYSTNPRLSSDFWCLKTSGMPTPTPTPIPPTPVPPTPVGTRTIIVVGGTITIDGKVV